MVFDTLIFGTLSPNRGDMGGVKKKTVSFYVDRDIHTDLKIFLNGLGLRFSQFVDRRLEDFYHALLEAGYRPGRSYGESELMEIYLRALKIQRKQIDQIINEIDEENV